MAKVEIKAKTGDSEPVGVLYDFGASDEDMLSRFSPKIVCQNARSNMVVTLQDVIRSGIKAGKSVKDIQKDVDAYEFGEKKRGKSKAEKIAEQFAELSDEAKAELLAQIGG